MARRRKSSVERTIRKMATSGGGGSSSSYQRAQAAAERKAAAEQRSREAEAKRQAAAAQRAQRARERDRAAAEKQRQANYVAARIAEAEALTSEIEAEIQSIEEILQATLEIDDYVDLVQLADLVVAEHPPFRSEHLHRVPQPPPLVAPPEPRLKPPPPLTGLRRITGRKDWAAALEAAQAEFEQRHVAWREESAELPARQLEALRVYQAQEQRRSELLAKDQRTYDQECRERDAAAAAEAEQLRTLQHGLASGDAEAVTEHLNIVLSRSVYPDGFEVEGEVEFDGELREATVHLTAAPPDSFPAVKSYRYVKKDDEIVPSQRSQKDQKDRYRQYLEHAVLRTLHEIFEADRSGIVQTAALKVSIDHVDPAVGNEVSTVVAAAAVERDTFSEINLSRVTPAETIQHLDVQISRDPLRYVPVTTRGARG